MHRTAVLEGLDAEWHALIHSPHAAAAIDRWARRRPVLGQLKRLEDLLDLRRGSDGRRVLRALADVASFDDLAARTLLQALLPGLIRIARRERRDPDALQELVGLAWEQIRTYPPDRPGSVAANVLLDVQKRYRSYRRRDHPVPRHEADQWRSVEDTAIDRVLVEQVLAACRSGVISGDAASLVLRSRLDDEALCVIAAEHDIDVHCAETRRRRAERRLRDHLETLRDQRT